VQTDSASLLFDRQCIVSHSASGTDSASLRCCRSEPTAHRFVPWADLRFHQAQVCEGRAMVMPKRADFPCIPGHPATEARPPRSSAGNSFKRNKSALTDSSSATRDGSRCPLTKRCSVARTTFQTKRCVVGSHISILASPSRSSARHWPAAATARATSRTPCLGRGHPRRPRPRSIRSTAAPILGRWRRPGNPPVPWTPRPAPYPVPSL
jgi:hypothetical protein